MSTTTPSKKRHHSKGSKNKNSDEKPTNNNSTSSVAFVQLIASLFELSKAANEASKAAVDFFNVVDSKPQYTSSPLLDQALLASQTQHLGAQASASQQLSLLQQQLQAQQNSGSGHNGESSKKKKKYRDPNAPKKPLTSFFLYSNYMRDVIIKERVRNGEESLSQPQIAQETSRRWKMLSDSEKAAWKELYEGQKKEYVEELKKYNDAKASGEPYTAPKRKNVILAPTSYKKRSSDDDGKRRKRKRRD